MTGKIAQQNLEKLINMVILCFFSENFSITMFRKTRILLKILVFRQKFILKNEKNTRKGKKLFSFFSPHKYENLPKN